MSLMIIYRSEDREELVVIATRCGDGGSGLFEPSVEAMREQSEERD